MMASDRSCSRGALIVFEGGDRCGKTTQCSKLVEHLNRNGAPAVMWRFPDRSTSIGSTINAYLENKANMDDAVIHLLFVANRMEKRSELLSLLSRGTTLVVDRYSYSGVAYTAAKGVQHLGADYCRAVEVGLPAADVVVQLALSAEETAARGGYGQERYEKMDFQQKVMEQFDALRDERWAVVDAKGSMEEVHQRVVRAVEPALQRVAAGAPLCRLWDYTPLPLELPAAAAEAGAQQQQQQAAVAVDAIASVAVARAGAEAKGQQEREQMQQQQQAVQAVGCA